jgi:hypothetical protein
LEVLKGAAKLFQAPHLPVLLLEVSDLRTAAWNYRAKEIVDFLQERGYSFFSVSPGGELLPACVSEEFLDTNLVALPRNALHESRGSSQPTESRP